MNVVCIANTGAALSEKNLSGGNSRESVFDLVIGQSYTVYGMCIWQDSLHYLLVGASNYPSWYPAELFEISNSLLPLEWYFNYVGTTWTTAIWGYKELVTNDSHEEDLMERKAHALEIFMIRKTEIDEWATYES